MSILEANNKLPPSNIEVEIELLGSILFDSNVIYQVAESLPVEAFSANSHREIYKACVALYKQHQPVNTLSVTSYLADKKLLAQVGGQSMLSRLVGGCIYSDNATYLAELLTEKFVRRQLINLVPQIESQSFEQDKPLAWILENIEQQVLNVTQLRNAKTGRSYWQAIDDVAFERLCKDLDEVEAIENAAQRDWLMKKLAKKWKFSNKKELLDFHAKWLDSRSKSKTYTAKEYFEKHGLSEQEWLIPGFIPAESVIVLYADGGVGKTRLAFSLAKSAVTGGTFAYEGTEFDPMNTLLIETDQGPRITSKLLEMQELVDGEHCQRLHICDEWSVGEFGKLKAMLKQHQPKLVIIDSLTSISVDSLYSENEAEYARPLVRLRHLAKEFGCSFLIIHHSNANGDMRGSRAIRNTVDEVWKFTKTQTELETYNCLTIDKTRSRAPASYKFTYDDDVWGWKFKGRVEDSAIAPGAEAQSTRIMFQCIDYLKENGGIPYECSEIAHALGLNINSVRRDLKRAVAEGLVSSGRGQVNKRALVYYVGTRKARTELLSNITTDQLITTDQMADQIENAGLSILSAPTDQMIKVITDFENSNCEEKKFSGRCDQMITSTANPDTEPKLSDHTQVITSDTCDQLLYSVTIPDQDEPPADESQPTKPTLEDNVYYPGQKVEVLADGDFKGQVLRISSVTSNLCWLVRDNRKRGQHVKPIGPFAKHQIRKAQQVEEATSTTALDPVHHQLDITSASIVDLTKTPEFIEGHYYWSEQLQQRVKILRIDEQTAANFKKPVATVFRENDPPTQLALDDLRSCHDSPSSDLKPNEVVLCMTGYQDKKPVGAAGVVSHRDEQWVWVRVLVNEKFSEPKKFYAHRVVRAED
ncbi:AAA family ATPase [Anabaena azotica]|uniref:AAA family ATPase n=1 Tax=Anabaena azotica FACHB-119 TaxID=947527 RepID=A0ABR8D8A4_9NOST|nr:AAA family ATPase [Anabaena azotica]MBD2503425.1 AAA family ATPase [Anabaena azotica FACHB-119]